MPETIPSRRWLTALASVCMSARICVCESTMDLYAAANDAVFIFCFYINFNKIKSRLMFSFRFFCCFGIHKQLVVHMGIYLWMQLLCCVCDSRDTFPASSHTHTHTSPLPSIHSNWYISACFCFRWLRRCRFHWCATTHIVIIYHRY